MIDFILLLKAGVYYTSRLYQFLLIGNVILSWVRPDPYNPVVRFIRRSTDPVIDLVRRSLPFLRAGMIDFSPIVVFLLLDLVTTLFLRLLDAVAQQTA